MKFLHLLLTILIVFLLGPTLGKSKSKKKPAPTPLEKQANNKREEYRRTKCSYLTEDMQLNCQNFYLSPDCFRKVYGDFGLEFGEVVTAAKTKEFDDCYKR